MFAEGYAANYEGVSSSLGAIDLQAVINQGFEFGKTFIQSKYAKDASKYAGGYYPQGQTQPTYAQISATNPNDAVRGATPVANAAGGFVASFTHFVEQNIGVIAVLGGVVLLFQSGRPKRG